MQQVGPGTPGGSASPPLSRNRSARLVMHVFLLTTACGPFREYGLRHLRLLWARAHTYRKSVLQLRVQLSLSDLTGQSVLLSNSWGRKMDGNPKANSREA